jgi:thiol-disulfide isomerase/thioredoxin
MRHIMMLIVLLPFAGMGQMNLNGGGGSPTGGIEFENGLNWQEVKAKAKAEHKFIFIDCYASWCVPCKEMDKNVYGEPMVGYFINKRFVSVKVKMDSSATDNEAIREWYKDGLRMQDEYNIAFFPSYLFFSPDGRIVHKYFGALSDTDFIKVAGNALDPHEQFYTLLDAYKTGRLDLSRLEGLANFAWSINDTALANGIAADYIRNYLDTVSDVHKFYYRKNLEFINTFCGVLRSKDRYFMLLRANGDTIDQIMKAPEFSRMICDIVITKEEIKDRIKSENAQVNADPHWIEFSKAIQNKYGMDDAERIVLNSELEWYFKRKDWKSMVNVYIKRTEKYGLDTSGYGKYWNLNSIVFEIIFKHIEDTQVLDRAIHWMEQVVKEVPNDPETMDTYANLLYKIGEKQKALDTERRALEICIKNKDDQVNDFKKTLLKMESGKRTWE